MSLELSLYAIESDLVNLIEMREQVREELGADATPEDIAEETAAIDNAIALYIKSEITKVDNIRAFWRHCELMRDAAKEEARVQSDRSKAWGARLDRLKATCALVMESIPFPAGKPKKLEGRTGALYLKANGGKQAVEVTDESLVPDEYKRVRLSMSKASWAMLLQRAGYEPDIEITSEPSLSLIGEALQKPCGRCEGTGRHECSIPEHKCPECGGSGHQSVPGCRLSPRSNHVECK